ncbi:MAG TPA: hypothetical protein VL422_17605 [Miltoncostaea sp.]|nr:hypothetical protein [Miltoncostaea sp.]
MAITERSGAAGPRPALTGTGLDVWEVVETARLVGNHVARAARYLEIDESLVREALAHAEAHPRELAAFTALQRAVADDDLRRAREGLA